MAKGTVERRIGNAFEGLFARAFKSKVTPMQIGRRLLQTVDAERDLDSQGRRVVPNTYLVQLSPDDREGLSDIEPALLYELTEALRQHIGAEGFHVQGKARVALRTNTDLRRGRFDITSKNVDQEGATESPAPAPAPEAPAADVPAPPETVMTAPVAPVIQFPGKETPPPVITVPGGQRVELHEGHYVVGRHLECDIVISDTNVSRKHAEFVCAGSDVIVRDLGSTNGTKVNGVVIKGDQLLQHGDVIGFGTAQVKFEAS